MGERHDLIGAPHLRTMQSGLSFSVVIPTCDRVEQLAACLDSLAPGAQSLPSDRYEVIVADDGSRVSAKELLGSKYPWVRWVAGPRQGPAANRNSGTRMARGAWLAFIDDDCTADPQWLASLQTAASRSDALALEGAIHPVGDPEQDLAECPVNLNGGVFWSANIAVERGLFDAVGGFDASYSIAAHEDQDLFLRLGALTAIPFVREAVVFHPVRLLSLPDALSRVPARCRALAHHLRKHHSTLGYRSDLNVVVARSKIHLVRLLHHSARLRSGDFLVEALTLVMGVPLTWKYLRDRK